jgi:hypothetical protein
LAFGCAALGNQNAARFDHNGISALTATVIGGLISTIERNPFKVLP